MGSVYDVEDVTVGKRYVLKTLHPHLVSRQDLAKRMEAEARALAKLQHPNIVDVVTAGVTTDDKRVPFYVMERLNGQNLRVIIAKKSSLELSHCYRIAVDVLDALEHAHENAIIHRDVKPENIFLHRNVNGTTITKLLDFGIMRLLDREVSHTQGKFIGTLRYASPEQVFGGDVGPATDIYSLGVVLYEMLAGRGPFDDVGDAYAIGAAHAQKPPPPLSRFVALPPALERLVMASMAKSPEDRPRDCFSFASELRRMLRDEEAAPKSATKVNVLSSVPQTRTAAELAGTELSTNPGHRSSAPTDMGMLTPSLSASPVCAEPITAGRSFAQQNHHGVGAPNAIALGDVATLASRSGILDNVPGTPVLPDAPPRPVVDRAAETHASGASGDTVRVSHSGTEVDDGAPPQLFDDAVRAALAQCEPFVLPPTTGAPPDPCSHELVFPNAPAFATGTGPLAGEARTRPPAESGKLLPLLGVAAAFAMFVGGAVLFAMKPWVRPASGTRSPIVATPTASAAAPPVIEPPAGLPTAPAPATPPASTATAAHIGEEAVSVPAAEPTARPAPRVPSRSVFRADAPAAPPATPPASAARKPSRPTSSGPPLPADIRFD
jgi:serine/threonine-protein kinase